MDMDDGYSPMGQKKSKVGFKSESMFLDGDSDDDHMNGGVKKVKIGKQNGFEEQTSFGPHVIKVMVLEHTDVTLVSTNNQEVPCHRFILAARSPVFKRLFASQAATGELLRESIDSSTEALKAMVKYLYTDTLENADINEDLMNLA